MNLKIPLTATLLTLVAGFLVWDYLHQTPPQAPAQTIPATTSTLPAPIQALISHDKPLTLIHLWATWCPPCMAEMPEMLATLRTPPADIHIVLISLDTNPDVLTEFYGKNKITPTPAEGPQWIFDPNQALAKALLPKPQLPATFVFNRQGQLVQRVDGPMVWGAFLNVLKGYKQAL